MHVWGKWNAKSGMLGLFPWMFKHSPLPDAHLKYYHTWKRCTSGLSFFKQMNEDQHCHQDPRWLCWLWPCSGCWSMRMNNPLYFHYSVVQVPSFELGLEEHFKQHLMAPLKSVGGRGLWLRAECGEGSRLPDLLHRHEKPPLSLLLLPTHRTTAAPRAPPREHQDASALASMQVVWPGDFGQPRAEQSTPAVLSPPRGRAPDAGTPPVRSPVRPEIASPPLSTPAPRKPRSELSTN